MNKERREIELLQRALKCIGESSNEELCDEIEVFLAQSEQTEHIKKKKEPEIYFVKDEFGTLRPTFKNPKETPLWIDVLHRGG